VDDLPTRCGFSEDECESARGIASPCTGPLKFEFADSERYVGRQRSNLNFTKGQLPHGLSIRIASAVAFENCLSAPSRDNAADKGGLRRVFIIRRERSQIPSIPRRLGILEQSANFVALRE